MGIDFHALKLIQYATKHRPLGKTLTLGRQALHINELALRAMINVKNDYQHPSYCEPLLLNYFGASQVDSVDNSDYEQATLIHDMNQELPDHLMNQYDTVIDGGCLEHIYHAPQALKNCSSLLKPGGQLLHILPANNFCGHGFWQFSPELFFSLYSKENGYIDTEIFLANLADHTKWYKVNQPIAGKRVEVIGKQILYVLVRSIKQGAEFSHQAVQQSDYIYEWDKKPIAEKPQLEIKQKILQALGNLLKRNSRLHHHAVNFYEAALRFHHQGKIRLSKKNPNLSIVKLD